jgi:DNA-binding MarR family transcriptional regulator
MSRFALIPRIHTATHRIDRYLASAGDPRLTQGEAHVLAYLAERGDSTINQVHHAFGHRRSTLTSIIDRLERAGLAERQINPDDRRTLLIRLTPSGARRAHRVRRTLADLEVRVTARFAKRDLAAAAAVLDAFARLEGVSVAVGARAPVRR